MHKLEIDMLKAIENNQNATFQNTYVNPVIGGVEVLLHGNHIATVDHDGTVKVNIDTLKAFPSQTTLSRLKALGVDVCKRKGEVVLNGEPLK